MDPHAAMREGTVWQMVAKIVKRVREKRAFMARSSLASPRSSLPASRPARASREERRPVGHATNVVAGKARVLELALQAHSREKRCVISSELRARRLSATSPRCGGPWRTLRHPAATSKVRTRSGLRSLASSGGGVTVMGASSARRARRRHSQRARPSRPCWPTRAGRSQPLTRRVAYGGDPRGRR